MTREGRWHFAWRSPTYDGCEAQYCRYLLVGEGTRILTNKMRPPFLVLVIRAQHNWLGHDVVGSKTHQRHSQQKRSISSIWNSLLEKAFSLLLSRISSAQQNVVLHFLNCVVCFIVCKALLIELAVPSYLLKALCTSRCMTSSYRNIITKHAPLAYARAPVSRFLWRFELK